MGKYFPQAPVRDREEESRKNEAFELPRKSPGSLKYLRQPEAAEERCRGTYVRSAGFREARGTFIRGLARLFGGTVSIGKALRAMEGSRRIHNSSRPTAERLPSRALPCLRVHPPRPSRRMKISGRHSPLAEELLRTTISRSNDVIAASSG